MNFYLEMIENGLREDWFNDISLLSISCSTSACEDPMESSDSFEAYLAFERRLASILTGKAPVTWWLMC